MRRTGVLGGTSWESTAYHHAHLDAAVDASEGTAGRSHITHEEGAA